MTSVRRINFWCKAATATFAAGALGAAAAAVWTPYDVPERAVSAVSPLAARAAAVSAPRLAMSDFDPFLSTPLGWPGDAPPAPPTPVVEAPPPAPAETPAAPPALQLIGTITEPDHSYALFQTPSGVELKRAGETVANGTVVEISEGSAVVRNDDGQSQTLRVPPPPQTEGGS